MMTTEKAATLKSSMSTEGLLGRRVKAYIGQAWGVGKTETQAKAACELMAIDIIERGQAAKIEVRHGYLIVSQVESSESAWYTIQKISELKEGPIFSCCCMRPSGLKAAIDSHLAQYMTDEERTA